MRVSDLDFERPAGLVATAPPEARGLERDGVRMLVSRGRSHEVVPFTDLPEALEPGDLVVVNRSRTIPASLPASGPDGDFVLNLSTRYAPDLWLAEPRWSPARPGPLPLRTGATIEAAGLEATVGDAYPGVERLRFVRLRGDVDGAVAAQGRPIRYGYVERDWPLDAYATIFGVVPGSAEMPSAGCPFSAAVLAGMARRGVEVAEITLHCGVSSIEIDVDDVGEHVVPPEPFCVPAAAAKAVNAAHDAGRRVVAVGTTVVRALESATRRGRVVPVSGFTKLLVTPESGVRTVDALLTGLHDPVTTHLAMLHAIAGAAAVRDGYGAAVQAELLWHEWGDVHLLFR